MNEQIFTIYYPSPIEDDGAIRAAITLEAVGEKMHTHNESVWKGVECIGIITGRGWTSVEGEYREQALEVIEGIADILVNEYGMDEWAEKEDEGGDIVPPNGMEDTSNE